MFVEQLRRAVEASPRVELPKVSALLWKAFAAGTVSESDAADLSNLIEARKAIPATPKPAQRRFGSRPRSGASMERRRRWAASGLLPPAVAARFTLAEQAALSVVAAESRKRGDCRLTNKEVADVAGVSISTARNAVRVARMLGFISVTERRRSAFRSDSNIIRITDAGWRAWLRLGGVKSPTRSPIKLDNQGPSALRNRTWAAEGQGAGRVRLSEIRARQPDEA
jgi:hypothetical protein